MIFNQYASEMGQQEPKEILGSTALFLPLFQVSRERNYFLRNLIPRCGVKKCSYNKRPFNVYRFSTQRSQYVNTKISMVQHLQLLHHQTGPVRPLCYSQSLFSDLRKVTEASPETKKRFDWFFSNWFFSFGAFFLFIVVFVCRQTK